MGRRAVGRGGFLPFFLMGVLQASALPDLQQAAEAQWLDTRDLLPMPEVPTHLTPVERASRIDELIRLEPDRYDLRLRGARAYSTAALLGADAEIQKNRAARAMHHADEATRLEPSAVEGRYWRAVSTGILADLETGRTQIRLAERSWNDAGWILAVDSLHAGAHHIRGRVHAAVQRVNPVVRFLARILVGGEALSETSWEGAEHHLGAAARLEPETPMYHFDLAVLYQDLDRPREKRAALEATLDATGSVTPEVDEHYRDRARALLDDLETGDTAS